MQTASLTTLHVSGNGPEMEIPLDPAGAIIGRAPSCHVVLDSPRISRQHARIYQDPFGRWLIEDLGSRNGVWANNQPVETHAILPGENITIGPYELSLVAPTTEQIEADPTTATASTIIEEGVSSGAIIASAKESYDALSGVRLRQLNAIIDRLAELTNPGELYPELCRSLARSPQMMAVVLRLPNGNSPMTGSPTVLASHIGGQAAGRVNPAADNLHISRRVIDAVRETGNAVMAGSTRGSEYDLALTIADERTPRAVLCSPLGEGAETIDVCYLDIPSGHATSEMLDFVRAVGRQVSFARKSLLLSEAKAERRALDRQLSMATEIQATLTPEILGHIPGVDTALFYKPAMWVGGDYCDMWALEDGRMAFIVADVSGKGLPAAMVMSNLQAALRITMSFCPDPAEAVRRIDAHMSNSMPERMFVTMFLGLFDPSDGKLQYVNAGHILPVTVGPDGAAGFLGQPINPPVGLSVGSFEAPEEFIAPGAGVVVVTDGITESMSPEGEEFSPERFQETLAATPVKDAAEMVRRVSDAAKAFRMNRPQQDDITVFAMRNSGTAG